jgi:Tol biopolymer transport system component
MLLGVLLAPRASLAGDPNRVWGTYESEHFVVHYYEPLGPMARRVAVVAERAHAILSPALDHVPDEKCQVLLVDDVDGANGFAGVLPRNAITLFATAPAGSSVLDDHDDWLYGLVAHEYTHILHLDTMSGLPKIVNAVLGKTWAPNQIMPRWIIEGIATYEESKRSSGGRTRASSFDMYIRAAVVAGKQLRLDEVSGAPRALPRGNAAYVYGSHFLRYVFDRFGDDTLRKMSHASGSYPVPFAINRQISKVTGSPFTVLYDDWSKHLRDRYALQQQAVDRQGTVTGQAVTMSAEANLAPRVSADSKEIVWFQSDGSSKPSIRAIPNADSEKPMSEAVRSSREVFADDALGAFALLPNGGLVVEQTATFRRDYTFQDLFWWDRASGKTIRLTTGARARDPAVSRDGRHIAFSQNGESSSTIAVMDFAAGSAITTAWRGARYDQAYQPSWSPDGTRIVFCGWQQGGMRDILVLTLATATVEHITHDRALDSSPHWSPDGNYILFDSDRTGISNVFAYDTTTSQLYQVTNVVGGAFDPAVSQNQTTLVYSGYDFRGYNIYSLPYQPSSWRKAASFINDRPPPVSIPDDEVAVDGPRPYRPMETLAPQSVVVQAQLGTFTQSTSLQLGGSDTAGVHGYNLALGLGAKAQQLNVGAAYSYSGWRHPVRFSASRSISDRTGFRVDGVSKPYQEEQWSATFSLGIPSENRATSNWSMSLDYDVDWNRIVSQPNFTLDPTMRVPRPPQSNYVQSGLAFRVAYGSVRGWTFGLGPQRGWDVSSSFRLDHPALGATYRNVNVNWAGRAFLRLPFGATPTVTARIGGSFRAGDLIRGGGFSLGGVPSQDVVQSIIDSSRYGFTGFLHGYPSRSLLGNQLHVANVEYRQELFQIEHGVSSLPIYLRRVHMAGLLDAAAAWDTDPSAKNTRLAVGGALRLDAFFGYFVPGTFEVGYARGLINGGIHEGWMLLTGSL